MNLTIPKIDYKIIVNQNDPSFEDEAKKFNYAIIAKNHLNSSVKNDLAGFPRFIKAKYYN